MGRHATGARPPARRRAGPLSAARLARLERENRRLRGELKRRRDDAPPVVELRLLGPPHALLRSVGGEREVTFRLRRSLLLLAFLALSPGRRAARQAVADALWPDAGRERVLRSFHPVVSVARGALREVGGDREFVVASGGSYLLDPGVRWVVDVDERSARIEQGEERLARGERAAAVAAWQAAWKLYRGGLLQGVDAPWADEARDALRQEHLGLLRRLAELQMALGRGEEAMDVYRALLIEDPLQESAHLALMGVYARQGRRDLVRRQYERLCALLRAELGAEPLLRTTLEYHTLMA